MPDGGRAGLDSLDLLVEGGVSNNVEGGVSNNLVAIVDGRCSVEQPGILERLDFRKVPQGSEPEHGQKSGRGHVGSGGARKGAARPGGDEIGVAQAGDAVAVDL